MSYLVLFASRYEFEDTSGRLIKGTKLIYCDSPITELNSKGLPPITVTGDYGLFNKLSAVPGLYDLSFRMKPDSKGKASLSLTDLSPVDPLDDILSPHVSLALDYASPR